MSKNPLFFSLFGCHNFHTYSEIKNKEKISKYKKERMVLMRKELKLFKDLYRGDYLENRKVNLINQMSRSLYCGDLDKVPAEYDNWFVLDAHNGNQFGEVITVDYYGY